MSAIQLRLKQHITFHTWKGLSRWSKDKWQCLQDSYFCNWWFKFTL